MFLGYKEGPLVISRVIRALNRVIRILTQVIILFPLTVVSIVRGPLPVHLGLVHHLLRSAAGFRAFEGVGTLGGTVGP